MSIGPNTLEEWGFLDDEEALAIDEAENSMTSIFRDNCFTVAEYNLAIHVSLEVVGVLRSAWEGKLPVSIQDPDELPDDDAAMEDEEEAPDEGDSDDNEDYDEEDYDYEEDSDDDEDEEE